MSKPRTRSQSRPINKPEAAPVPSIRVPKRRKKADDAEASASTSKAILIPVGESPWHASSFPERLKMRSRHYGVPLASTPIQKKLSPFFSAKDADNYFGFGVSDEEKNESLISPIVVQQKRVSKEPKRGSQAVRRIKRKAIPEGDEEKGQGFDALLEKYRTTDSEDEDSDPELHIDTAKIKKTYGHPRKENIPIPLPIPHLEEASDAPKPASKHPKSKLKPSKQPNPDSDDLDQETKRWLKETNKEFDKVLHVPLVVERHNENVHTEETK